jgi:hypothetical protein
MREPLGTSGLKEGAAGAVGSKHRENRAMGKVRQSTDVGSTALGKEEMAIRLWAIRDEQPYGGSNVACTTVAMQRPRNKANKQRPFIGNGSVNTFLLQ